MVCQQGQWEQNEGLSLLDKTWWSSSDVTDAEQVMFTDVSMNVLLGVSALSTLKIILNKQL